MRRHILDNPLSYYAIFIFARYVPTKLCHWLGKLVAMLVYPFSRNDREGFGQNLSIALRIPRKDPKIRKITLQMFKNYGEYMVDFFLMPQLPPNKVDKFFAYLKGEENLINALNSGKGAILLSAHVGNWEFGGTLVGLSNYPLAVVALAHNTSTTNSLVNKLRGDKGIKVIEMDESPFSGIKVLQHLRSNGVVAMIGDKDFFGNGWPVSFFGEKVNFPLGPVVLAMKSGAALIPSFVLKQTNGKYFGILEEAIPLKLDGERDEAIKHNLAKTARVFEKYIRNYPDQWYCPHPITAKVLG